MDARFAARTAVPQSALTMPTAHQIHLTALSLLGICIAADKAAMDSQKSDSLDSNKKDSTITDAVDFVQDL